MPDTGFNMPRAEILDTSMYPPGVLLRCPNDSIDHKDCSSCPGSGMVLPKPWNQSNDIFDKKRLKRLSQRSALIF